MLKLIFAIAAVALAAFALWRQTASATPRYYAKIHVVGRPEQAAHPEFEAAVRSPFASSYRRKRLLTHLQLLAGLAACGLLVLAIAIAAVLFTRQHFHIKARLGLEKEPPVRAQFVSGNEGIAPSAP